MFPILRDTLGMKQAQVCSAEGARFEHFSEWTECFMNRRGAGPEKFIGRKVARTIPEDLLHRGQQISVYTHLLAAAHEIDDCVVEDSPQHAASADLDGEE